MSTDIVDDLHHAEDYIAQLEFHLAQVLLAVETDDAELADTYGHVLDAARQVLEGHYCRISCEDDCEEDCGCPCHDVDEEPIPLEREFPELWGHEPEEPNVYHGTYSED